MKNPHAKKSVLNEHCLNFELQGVFLVNSLLTAIEKCTTSLWKHLDNFIVYIFVGRISIKDNCTHTFMKRFSTATFLSSKRIRIAR